MRYAKEACSYPIKNCKHFFNNNVKHVINFEKFKRKKDNNNNNNYNNVFSCVKIADKKDYLVRKFVKILRMKVKERKDSTINQ